MTSLDKRLAQLPSEQRKLAAQRLRDRATAADRRTGAPPVPPAAGDGDGSGPSLSVFYFSADAAAGDGPYELLLATARFADDHGFAAAWLPERHFQRIGGPYPNPSVLAAALAMCTRRIGLRAGSVVLPLHDPIRVAEEWSVVDNLSGGRVGVSFATGWHPGDFALAPGAYGDRRARTHDGIDTVRRLWRGEGVGRQDGNGTEIDVRIQPRPVQPELPVWLTVSGNPESWVRAAELGTSVLCAPISLGPDGIIAGIAAYREACAESGRPGRGHVTMMLHTFVGTDTDSVRVEVEAPLKAYLSAFLAQYGTAQQLRTRSDLDVREDDRAPIVKHAFDRYFDGWSLLGDDEKCRRVLDEVTAAGVDEVACLVDFGSPLNRTLESLHRLAALHESLLTGR
jgi:natural product biosynthesis luciferase-like monooxygenase protein